MSNGADRDVVKGAVEDVKALKEAALEAAKNRLAEELVPGLRKLLDESLLDEKRGLTGRGKGQSQRADYMSPKLAKWEESKDKGEVKMAHDDKKDDKELDLESLASFFPQMTEDPEPDPDPGMDPSAEHDMEHPSAKYGKRKVDPSAKPDEAMIPQLGEMPEGDPEEHEKEKCEAPDMAMAMEGVDEQVDEQVEISESELKKVYLEALQTEVQVKKGFSDMTKAGELEEVDPAAGLADVKKGEAHWENEEPPAAEKHIPESKVRALIVRGLNENKSLKGQNQKLRAMVENLAKKLHEVNLFNAKVLLTNRILNSGRLSKEQRQVAMESIDKARTIAEAKVIFEAVVNSFKAALTESRHPKANVQGARRSGSPKQDVLRESVDRQGTSTQYARFAELAGLVK
jgi:hypothetical protein